MNVFHHLKHCKMSEKEQKLHEQIAQMEGDIRTTVNTFFGVLKSLKINPEDFKNGDIMSKLPSMLTSISVSLMSGTFDNQAIANLQALAPIMTKYKYLVPELLNDGQ